MSRSFIRRNLKKNKHKEYKENKYKQIRIQEQVSTSDLEDGYKFSLTNPLNILLLLYLYKQHSPIVMKNPDLLKIAEKFEQDKHIKVEDSKISDKGFIRMVWLWQMAHHSLYCDLCGRNIELQRDLTLDHKIPKSKGGKVDFENSRPAHKKCNNVKGSILPETWKVVGPEILKSYGIPIIYRNCGYNYSR